MALALSRGNAAPAVASPVVSAAGDARLLDDLQRRAFDFFWNETHPKTGLTRDRARNLPGPDATHTVASVAATGYALAALPIGVERGWVERGDAYRRAVAALRFVHDRLPHERGFYHHFVQWDTGVRAWNSEVSSIDSALLALGALTAGRYWRGTEAERLSRAIYARMDWRWMQRGGADGKTVSLAMGWTPEKGWIAARWEGYSEASFLYLLAMGAPKHALGRDAWDRWEIRIAEVEGYTVFGGPSPLFWAQMTPGFYDLRGKRDRQGRDWWTNFANAHRVDRAYCRRNAARVPTYAAGYWGITACDQPPPVGYAAHWPADGHNDGTVAPTAMAAGILFTPVETKAALRRLRERESGRLWGRYGFSNAFNVGKGWYDPEAIGIDLGMMLLALENHRTGLVWRLLAGDPAIRRGMDAAGMR